MIKNDIKIAAFDLDDTLLDTQGRLTDYTIRVMENASAQGIEMVIASGRPYFALPKELVEQPWMHYAICSNGARIYDLRNGECISACYLSEKSINRFLEVTDGYGNDIFRDAFTKGNPHSEQRYLDSLDLLPLTETRKRYLRWSRIPEPDIKAFIKENIFCMDCLNVICFDPEMLNNIRMRITEEVEDIFLTSSIPHMIEMSDKKSGKGKALHRLAGILGVELTQTAGFGNSENDSEMLIYAGLGCAVANSDKEALEAADKIIGANSEDGVAKEIESWL